MIRRLIGCWNGPLLFRELIHVLRFLILYTILNHPTLTDNFRRMIEIVNIVAAGWNTVPYYGSQRHIYSVSRALCAEIWRWKPINKWPQFVKRCNDIFIQGHYAQNEAHTYFNTPVLFEFVALMTASQHENLYFVYKYDFVVLHSAAVAGCDAGCDVAWNDGLAGNSGGIYKQAALTSSGMSTATSKLRRCLWDSQNTIRQLHTVCKN